MSNHVNEHDEFLLSQLLDGDLSEQEASALRARMEAEPELRAAFERLSRLHAMVAARRSDQPVVDYQRFHEQLMQRIAPAARVSEQDELLLNELLDGELAAQQEQATLARLQAEPALREVHESLVRVNAALVERRAYRPNVDYDQFHKRLMSLITAEAGRMQRVLRFPMWARVAAPLAAAAAIALVVWMHPGVQPVQPADRQPGVEIAKVEQDSTEYFAATDMQPAGVSDEASGSESIALVKINAPSVPADRGAIQIEFGRSVARGSQAQAIEVSFARSTEIAEEVRRVDEERAAQPARKVFFASANTSAINDGLTGELF